MGNPFQEIQVNYDPMTGCFWGLLSQMIVDIWRQRRMNLDLLMSI